LVALIWVMGLLSTASGTGKIATVGLGKQTEEIIGGDPSEFISGDTFDFSDMSRSMCCECGLAALAPHRHRGQIGRVGLYQQLFHWDVAGDLTYIFGILEGDDPRKGYVHPVIERATGDIRTGTETVDHTWERVFPLFFTEDAHRIFIGIPGMNDDRKSCLLRRRDMGAKDVFLDNFWRMLVIEIQARFPDTDDFGVIASANDVTGNHTGAFFGLMGMNADGTPYSWMARGNGTNVFGVAKSGADAQHSGNACLAGTGDDIVLLSLEIRKIEVTMAVDEHV
jgi:hypothetical protein